MPEEVSHVACVDAWMARAAKGLPPERLLKLFEQALGALHRRTRVALGDVTLTAIVDRVLYNAAEKFPLLSTIKVEATGAQGGMRVGPSVSEPPAPRTEDPEGEKRLKNRRNKGHR